MIIPEEKLRIPKKQIYIKTTESCQLNCKHCYIGEARNKRKFFKAEPTIKWLQELKKVSSYSNEDFYFTFHGGEPLLCRLSELQKVIDAFPGAQFDATSNLVFPLEEKTDFILRNFYADMYKKPTIKTSWDPVIRFKSNSQYSQWKYNVQHLIEKGIYVRVGICCTSYLLSMSPIKVFNLFKQLGVHQIDFERLTSLPKNNPLYANYEDIDDWICRFYHASIGSSLCISNVEGLKEALYNRLTGCRARKCNSNVITINADGTIGTCPNMSLSNSITSIYEPIQNYIFSNAKACLIKKECTPDNRCLVCPHYDACNGECCQLEWQGNTCPGFKKLISLIKSSFIKPI